MATLFEFLVIVLLIAVLLVLLKIREISLEAAHYSRLAVFKIAQQKPIIQEPRARHQLRF